MENDERIHQREFLELIEEVEAVNEYIRVFYNNKYLISGLVFNNIKMPSLFITQPYLDLFYHLERSVLCKSTSQCSTLCKSSREEGEEV